jgi:anti-sigma factor RsiW
MTAKTVSPRPDRDRDCRARLASLFAWLDGELSAARCREIERHLTGCACCEALATGLRRAILTCRAAGRERLPAVVRKRARARIARLLRSVEPG